MKSLFILLFSLVTYGITRYIFSQKRIRKQITKSIKIASFVRHLEVLNVVMMLVGLLGFAGGLIAILYDYYDLLVLGIALIGVASFYYYSVLGRVIANADDDLGVFSDFDAKGFSITRTSIYNTRHIGKVYWKDITTIYFNEDKTALLMDCNLEQPYVFSNQIENWEVLFKHIPKRFGHFEI